MTHFLRICLMLFPLAAAQALPRAEDLKSIKLPPGFEISLFVEAENARQMVLSPEGTLFIGSRAAGRVYAVPKATELLKAPPAEPVKAQVIASDLLQPNGVALHEGNLYVAAVSTIYRLPNIEANLKKKTRPREVVTDTYPSEMSHGWKYIAMGPDGWLYVPVGAPCNVCLRDEEIFSSITRMSLDGKKREIVAHGVRNTVGFDWHPETKELWFTDNGRDHLGDNKPGDELNRLAKPGQHFGFPHCHELGLPDPEFGKGKDCSSKGPYTQAALRLGPHVAALGMKFYRGSQFPAEYKHRVFIAERGSWNRTAKIGYRVMNARVKDGKASNYEVFASGWLQPGERVWGRPVDVLEMPDGSILVSDDTAGVVYRIAYTGKK